MKNKIFSILYVFILMFVLWEICISKAAGNAVANEAAKAIDASKYVAGELTKDMKARAGYINEAAQRGYVNYQNGLANMVDKSINRSWEYINHSLKTMEEQGTKVALTNGLAAGSVKLSFEANDYLSENKELTEENILNSTKEVGYSTGGLATSGMPLTAAVGLSVVGDWDKDGRYDVNKSFGSAVVGSVIESKFGNNALSPTLREIGASTFEKAYERTITGGKDE